MRFAGMTKQYSISAIDHETSTAIQIGAPDRLLRCPYHAYSMTRLETHSNPTVNQLMLLIFFTTNQTPKQSNNQTIKFPVSSETDLKPCLSQ